MEDGAGGCLMFVLWHVGEAFWQWTGNVTIPHQAVEEQTALAYQLIRNNAVPNAVQVRNSNMCLLLSVIIVNVLYCVVDGGWSNWTVTTECTRSCGGGILVMGRSCSNPRASCGGQRCSGASRLRLTCNTHCCQGNNNAIMQMILQQLLFQLMEAGQIGFRASALSRAVEG